MSFPVSYRYKQRIWAHLHRICCLINQVRDRYRVTWASFCKLILLIPCINTRSWTVPWPVCSIAKEYVLATQKKIISQRFKVYLQDKASQAPGNVLSGQPMLRTAAKAELNHSYQEPIFVYNYGFYHAGQATGSFLCWQHSPQSSPVPSRKFCIPHQSDTPIARYYSHPVIIYFFKSFRIICVVMLLFAFLPICRLLQRGSIFANLLWHSQPAVVFLGSITYIVSVRLNA